MKSLGTILAAPLACLGILVGIMAEESTHLEPQDADAYHARAKEAVESIPDSIGLWTGRKTEVPAAAVKLLRPNAYLSRQYKIHRAGEPDPWGWDRYPVDVLIVQCRDSRDMVGHYPEACYPQSGRTLVSKEPVEWDVGGLKIPAMEYHFERFAGGRSEVTVVYNFLVVPGQDSIVRTIEGVNKAAEDYQRRYFGAAQVQFVMSGDLASRRREEAVQTLLKEMVGPVKVLMSAEINKRGAAPAGTVAAAR